MATLDHLAGLLLSRLVWTSLQAAVLVGVVALLIRLLPRLPAAARCALWWLVGMQVVLGLCWQAPIALPLLAPPPAAQVVAPTRVVMHVDAKPTDLQATAAATESISTPSHTATVGTKTVTALATHWRLLLAAAWLLLLFAQLPALILQHRHTRRLRRMAKPLADATLQAQCSRQARILGLRHVPALLVSPDLASPQVSGYRRPVVLWPAEHALSAEESALALAHELAHLQRHDLPLGWIPALAQRLFFFHPLLRWAMHEYALHREAACDAQALQQQRSAPQDYGRLLLRLGVAHPPHAGLAGASPTFHNLKRRLTMLQQTSSTMPRARGWLFVAAVALVGVLPYRVVAANHAAHATSTAGATHNLSAMPAMPPMPPMPPMPAMPPPPPAPPIPPPPPPPPSNYGFQAHDVNIDIDSNAAHGFALFDDGTLTVQGTQADAAAIKRLPKTKAPLLWYRQGHAAYVIHDRAIIARAEKIQAPVTELARQQGELAGKQGALAGRQAGLAAREAAFAGRQADLAGQEAALAAQALNDTNRQAYGAQRQALAARKVSLEKEHAALRRELDAKKQSLHQQQAALRQQQTALRAQRQHTTTQSTQAMDALLQEAKAKGLAQEVSPR